MDPYRPPDEIADAVTLRGDISELASQGSPPGLLTKLILRRQFFVLLGVFFVVWCPLDLAISYLEQYHVAEDDFNTIFKLQQNAALWFGVIATAAAVSIIGATYDGRQQGFFAALGEGIRQWPKLWSTLFLYFTISFLGLIAFVFPGVIFAVRGLYAINISAAEDVYGPTAIMRSFAITKDRFAETFMRCLVVIGVYFLVALAYAGAALSFDYFVLESVDYAPGFYFDWPWWYWLASGVIACLMLPADVIAAVYVYCWYRHLDRLDFEMPMFETPMFDTLPMADSDAQDVNAGEPEPPQPTQPNPDFKW